MGNFKRILSVSLRICISAILLVLLFRFNKINTHDLVNDIRSANKVFLIVGFLIYFATYLLGFLRWKMLLEAVDMRIPLRKLISSFSGGNFFSIFLPSTIGGDIVRSADLAEHTRKTKEVIATVFLDRLSGYIGLVFVILPAIVLGGGIVHDKVVFSSMAMIVLLLVLVLFFLLNNFIY